MDLKVFPIKMSLHISKATQSTIIDTKFFYQLNNDKFQPIVIKTFHMRSSAGWSAKNPSHCNGLSNLKLIQNKVK